MAEGVEVIGYSAFSGCEGIEQLTLPQSIREITLDAFSGLGISTLTIPEGLEAIECGAFHDCKNLTKVNWNATNCSLSRTKGYGPFHSMMGGNFSPISEVVFGENVTQIPNNMFYGCTSLKTVRTSGSVARVGQAAFENTQWMNDQPEGIIYIDKALYTYKGSMTKATSINIPEGVESITYGAFSGKTYLVGITLPSTLKSIGNSTFSGCTALGRIEWNAENCEDFTFAPFSDAIYEVVFGNQVKHIPAYAFSECNGLEEVILPASVMSIGKNAFSKCKSLKHINCGEAIDSIGEGAFYDCDALTNVEFGEALRFIGTSAFYDCDNLESITLPEGLTYLSPGAFGSNDNLKHVVFNAIDCHTSSDRTATPVFTFQFETFVIGNKVTRIPRNICEGQGIKEIVIPNSVNIIESGAFNNTELTEVFLPAGVTEIGSGAFGGNTQLKIVIIASNEAAQVIAPFSGSALESILVPDVTAYKNAQGWSTYSHLIKPMVSFSQDSFVYSGKQPETEGVNNLTGYTLQLGELELEKDAGTYTAWAEASYTGPHTFTVSVPFAYQITKAPLHVSAVSTSRPYGEDNPEFELAYEGFAFDDDTRSLSVIPQASCEADKWSDTGEYEIKVSGGEACNYTFDYASGVLSVTAARQEIAWNQELPELHVGDSIALEASASSGLPVTFITSTPQICRITLAEGRYFLVCLAEGTAGVQATQAGNGNWLAAENVERELTVEAATGITSHKADRLTVCTDQRQIVVKGAAKGATISLHALNGTLLHRETGRSGELRFTVKQAGIYVVSVGNRAFKVTVE